MEAKQNTMLGVIAKVWVTLCLDTSLFSLPNYHRRCW